MKKLVTLSLFIFWAVVTAILTASLINYQNSRPNPAAPVGSTTGNTALNTLATNSPGGKLTLDLKEIAKHNSVNDCWLLINNKVYDVTGAISSHPGGAGTIIPNCGQEATQAFNTKDIGRPHSSNANTMLANYYIGNLNQEIIGQATATKPSPKPVNSTPINKTPNLQNNTSSSPTPALNNLTLDLAEISKHSSRNDCWLLINNKVYNVTSFLSAHPGGAGTIIPHCGQEATQAFNTKDIGRPHSSNAAAMLTSYYIGDLNQTTNSSTVQQTNNLPPPTNTQGEEGEDD